ncbi:MAG TPA: signal peptide peptidase SppA [Verrucomicrobiae bacterium]|jgi:protease-4
MDENVTPPAPERGPTPPTPLAQPPPLRSAPTPFAYPPQRPRRGGKGWKIFAFILLVLLVLSLVANPLHWLLSFAGGDGALPQHHGSGPRLQENYVKDNNSANRIVIVPIEGVISSQSFGRGGPTMVEVVEEQFRRAAEDKRVKAVILKVNSPGGEVLASDDIYNIIEKFQRKTDKPVVAAMGSLAASGGYYVSAPCQWIVANEMTITGSIGVIMHGYNFRGLMDKVGVRPEVFKSGKFKDMLSPDKREEDITQEEREIIQSMVNETFDKFKSVISEGRANAAKRNTTSSDKGKTLAENWTQYADGRILSGKEALSKGFIDELGNFDAAIARAQKLAKITDANLIQYDPVIGLGDLLGMFGQSEARTLKIDLGLDAPKLQWGQLYFIWPLALLR